MSGRALRSLTFGIVTSGSASLLALTAVMHSAFAFGETADAATGPATVGLVMGPSGIPLPEAAVPGYLEIADQLYIHPHFPDTTYPDPYANGLFMPNYPLLSVPLSINYPTETTGPLAGFPALITSMGQGMLILENAIASNAAAGDASTVFGWSQTATISGLVMQHLNPSGTPMPDDGLQFVLLGNPSNPDGGLLQRFEGLNLPSLGIAFDGATPANSFPTEIYTIQYDGFADFPKYPINFLADLNAVLGLGTVHGYYMNPDIISPAVIDQAILLPGSEALGADSLTNYYMIPLSALPSPYSYLPLLLPVLGIPVVGKPLADLLQPALQVLIELGYDRTGPADIPTPFGLFPDVNATTVFNDLITAGQQGFNAFMNDLSDLSLSPALSAWPSLADLWTTGPADTADLAPTPTDIINAITTTGAVLSALQLQLSDVANAVLTSLPAYDIQVFSDHLDNPLEAIGMTIAANTGLLTLAGGFDLMLIQGAITAAGNIFGSLIP